MIVKNLHFYNGTLPSTTLHVRTDIIEAKRIEYILERNLLEKSFNTAGVLHIFMLYNLLGPGISFYKNLELILKENQIMK